MTIYFDNSATTPVRKEVVDAMITFLSESFGNPSSIHCMGRDSFKAVAKARQNVAKLLNCEPTEVYFTACGTNSNNSALLGRARFAEANNLGKHLITTVIEHPSVIGPSKFLEANGWKVTYLPVDKEGFVRKADLENAITTDTSIVSIMWANNEIGTVEPIEELSHLVKAKSVEYNKEIFFHSDAIQAAGKVRIDTKRCPVSALSLSGHKFYAPKGVGIMYLRKNTNVMPLFFGGGQEKGIIPGTEGLTNIVAIGEASRLAHAEFDQLETNLRQMQTYLIEKLSAINGIQITGTRDLQKRLPGHVSVAVENAEGEALVMQLDMQGVCVSSASACHKGIIEPSHVLSALQVPCNMLRGSLRISLGKFNTMDECKTAVAIFEKVFSSVPAPKEMVST
mgnify:FL=1